MIVKYGNISSGNFSCYFESLVNKVFKILPMKEAETETLNTYLDSLLRELIGNSDLVLTLKEEPAFISVVSILSYLANEDYDIPVCRQEVFKCIHLLKDIRERCFGGDKDGEI